MPILKIPTKTTADNFNLQDYIDDFNALNEAVRDVSCRIRNSAAISVPHAQLTNITYDTEVYDTDNMHNLVTNTHRVYCNTAGKYIITGNIVFASNATGFRTVSISLNGISNIAVQTVSAASGVNTRMNLSTVINLAAGDFVLMQVYHSAGVALDVLSESMTSPVLTVTKIA
jgi:hypothetical protein